MFSVQKIGQNIYVYTMKEVNEINSDSVELLLSSLNMVCTEGLNTVLFDCIKMQSDKLQQKFFSCNFYKLLKINKKGFRKFIIVSTSTMVLLSTKLLSKLMGTSHVVFTCRTKEEGIVIASN